MAVQIRSVNNLLRMVSQKTKQSMDYTGWGIASMHINKFLGKEIITQRYLHENLFLRCLKDQPEAHAKISLEKLDLIASFLGYEDFFDFENNQYPMLKKEEKSLIGNWYSITRCNTSKTHLLISPLEVKGKNGSLHFSLKGKTRVFSGLAALRTGVLSVTLQEDDKIIYWILKTGIFIEPKLIQGVFASISSAGDPICGRKIIMKTEIHYSKMKNYRLSFENAKELDWISNKIVQYFENHQNGYVKVLDSASFNLDDSIVK